MIMARPQNRLLNACFWIENSMVQKCITRLPKRLLKGGRASLVRPDMYEHLHRLYRHFIGHAPFPLCGCRETNRGFAKCRKCIAVANARRLKIVMDHPSPTPQSCLDQHVAPFRFVIIATCIPVHGCLLVPVRHQPSAAQVSSGVDQVCFRI